MDDADPDLARRAWRAMSEIAHDHDRKLAVSEAAGMSWTRVLVLRRLAEQPLTLRGLAARIAADPPYVTLMVDDLEERGLVERRRLEWDRRTQVLHLRPEAAEVLAAARQRGEEALAQRLGTLDVDQTKRLVVLLQRFVTGE